MQNIQINLVVFENYYANRIWMRMKILREIFLYAMRTVLRYSQYLFYSASKGGKDQKKKHVIEDLKEK